MAPQMRRPVAEPRHWGTSWFSPISRQSLVLILSWVHSAIGLIND